MRAVDLADPVVAALGLEPQQALQVPSIIHLPAVSRYTKGRVLVGINPSTHASRACAADLQGHQGPLLVK